MPHSHHSHSGQFCKHASGLLEEVILEAIHQGFQLYGLSEHVPRYRLQDLYPEEEGLSTDALMKQFDDYLVEGHRLKALYASNIDTLVGLETEFITDADLNGLEVLLTKYGNRVEYIVGSVHHVNGLPIDFDMPTFEKARNSLSATLETKEAKQEVFLAAYFDAQYELLRRFKPEIIGHFDLCRMYTPLVTFAEYPAVWQRIERNVDYAIGYGALFEVNAAAFRKKWDTAYPATDMMEASSRSRYLIVKRGGRFALSDDSHGPHAVGLNYHRMAGYLRAVGVAEIWYLQSSSSPNAAGRSVRAVRVDGDWWDHAFWNMRGIEVS